MKDGEMISEEDDPPLGYDYDVPGEFDESCGTFGLDDFQLPNGTRSSECPATFVCDTPENAPFASCIDAMNCHVSLPIGTV